MGLGVDLGGTKTEAAILSEDGRFLSRERIETPKTYDETIRAIAEAVARAEAAAGVAGLAAGVGIPGSPSPVSGLIRNANSTWLNARPLARDLEAALARPVRLANDANCFALSEAVDGAGAGARTVFGVILGTGCGGGVVIEGRVLEGASGVAGEWGHNPLPWPDEGEWPGPECWCGKRGCLETWISGTGFAADYARAGGAALKAHDIAARAAAGEAPAQAALNRLCDRLARGLAHVINLIDPEVIVLGGGLSNIDALYGPVQARLARYVFSDHVAARVLKNRHGDSSGVRGAAWLWR